jgi:branched-chain amino acid aminotransferase
MAEWLGRYYSENFCLKETATLTEDAFETGKSYYEVLRVIDGICIFLEDHLNRLNESVLLDGLSFSLRLNPVSEAIRELIRTNNLSEGNIRLVLQTKDDNPDLFITCVPFSYPEPGQYTAGVSTSVFQKVRMNPNVKLYDPLYLRQVNEFRVARNVYEVLLADESGCITEGSKTNVFFILNNVIFTAPGVSVLKGITRQKVLLLCNELNYKVIEKSISIETLNTIEAVFLTGTSPKVLPVNAIDAESFAPDHPMIRTLMEAYERLLISAERAGRV